MLQSGTSRARDGRSAPKDDDRPLLSVVIFVLNAARTLERALASVTAADQPAVELIVMDGGSTDGTVDIIRRYGARIAFWRTRHDGSAAIAINEGVERATGDVICLLPGDDWIEPGALHVVSEQFRADPDLGVLSCGTRFARLDEDGTVRVEKEYLDAAILELTMSNIVRWPLTAARFIRRGLYNRLGGYNSEYLISNDLDFLIKVLLTRPGTRVVPQLVYNYRTHPGSRTLGGDPRMMIEMLRGNIAVAERHLPAPALRREERGALLGLHGRASARLGWMLLAGGEPANALRVVGRAIHLNWLFPLMVPIWMTRRALRRDNLF